MALTITPNTATPAAPTGASPQPLGPTSPAAPNAALDGVLTALHQIFTGTPIDVGPLGLRSPQNSEDAALILAEAQVALDKTTNQANNAAVQSRLGSVRGTLNATSAAIANAAGTLAAATAKKSADGDSLTTATASQTGLQATLDTLETVDSLDAQIATAQQSGDTAGVGALTAQRDDALSSLGPSPPGRSDVAAQLAAVQTSISGLDSAIDEDDSSIAAANQALSQGSAELANVFSDIARTLQTGNGATQRLADRSTRLELGFEDLAATIDKARDNDVARVKTDATTSGLHQHERNDASQLATALASGIAEALSVIRQAIAAAPIVPRDAAVTANNRIRLAL